jgi:hypothetical protein
MATSYNPPLPPEVLRQQVAPISPVAQFAAQGGPEAAPQATDTSAFLEDRLMQTLAIFKEMAVAISTDKPGLLPLMKVMIEAGSTMLDAVRVPGDSPTPDADAVPAQMPQGATPSQAVTMG